MANIQEAKRRLTIEATTRGVDEANAKLDRLAAGTKGVAAASETQERATVSAERALARIQRQYDATWKSQQEMARVERNLATAQAQGLITMQRRGELLGMAAERHGLATAAINREIDATQRLTNARRVAANQNAATGGMQGFNSTNAAYQIQDIAMMAALGQSPMATALQQGPQLAMVMQQGGGIAALASGLKSLVSWQMLAVVGMTAATAAAIQWVTSTTDGAEKIEEVLKRHKSLLSDLEDGYGRVAEKAREGFGFSSGDFAFRMARSENELRLLLASQSQTLASPNSVLGGFFSDPKALGITADFDARTSSTQFGVRGQFAAFEDEILRLHGTIVAGSPDFLAFRRAVTDRWNLDPNNEELTKQAKVLLGLTEQAAELETQYRRLKRAQEEFERNVEPTTGQLRASGSFMRDDMGRLSSFERTEQVARRRAEQAFEAELQSMRARSPRELADAARASAAATYNADESAIARRHRIDLAGRQALAQAEYDLAEAQRERMRSLDDTLSSQQLSVDLIGKSIAETERLRMEHQLTEAARKAAADAGVEADHAELEIIRQKAAEYGRLRAVQSAREIIHSQELSIERARVELGLMTATEAQRSRAIALMETELEIRRLGIDLYGQEAQAMRANAEQLANLAEVREQIGRTMDTWETIFDQARDGVDQLVDSLFEGGQDIGDVLKGIGRDFARLMFDLAITNPLKNWLTGSNLNSIADLGIFPGASSGRGGGFGGVLGKLLGAQQAVASMQVQAATVVVNGGVLGGQGGAGGLLGGITRLFNPANDNQIPGAINHTGGLIDLASRAPAATTSGGGVAGQVWNFFAGKGLKPHQIAGIMGNVSAESAFNPLAIGDGGNAFGLFQHNDRSSNLFNFLGGRGNLGNVQGQLAFAWKELQTTESRAMQALMGSRNVREATAAFGGFERPSGFSWNNPEGMHNWAGRLKGAEDALAKFGDATGTATSTLGDLGGVTQATMQGLQQFGIGAGNLGSMMQNLMTTGGGFGGNWFSSLAGMFGGAGGALNHMMGISPLATAHILGGGVGLFAKGGISDRPAIFGEAGPEAAVPLPDGRRIPVDLRVPTQGEPSDGVSRSDLKEIVAAIRAIKFNNTSVIVDDETRIGEYVSRYLRSDSGASDLAIVNRRQQGRAD